MDNDSKVKVRKNASLSEGLSSETPLARRARTSGEPASARRVTQQKFKVTEGTISEKKKAEKEKPKKKNKKEKAKKTALSPDYFSPSVPEEEIETEIKEKEDAKKKKKLEKRKRKKEIGRLMIGTRILLVLAAYVLVAAVCAGALYFFWARGDISDTFSLQIGPDADRFSRVTVSRDTAIRNGVHYCNVSDVALYCNLAVTGSSSKQKFTVKETGECAVFTDGSSLALVNGVETRLEGPCFKSGSDFYIPISFLNSCVSGISSEVNETRGRTYVTRDLDKDGNYVAIGFDFDTGGAKETSSINFMSLDEDLRKEIELRQEINGGGEPDDVD